MFDGKVCSHKGEHVQLAEQYGKIQTQGLVQQRGVGDPVTGTPAQHIQARWLSYHPTGNAYADALLTMIDRLTRGHADWFQRACSYLLIGGCSTMVNLLVFTIVYYRVLWPVNQQWHYVVAFAMASEVSILANFFPNDAITFRRLPGHHRPWFVRCTRFHLSYLLGTLLQLCISFSLHLLGSPALVAQAAAIAIVTAFNFVFHHIFTYRRVAHSKKSE